ncbi:MAG: hypothetical protein AB7V45_13995 [Candidatus Krumholzibacteriia bacterium]
MLATFDPLHTLASAKADIASTFSLDLQQDWDLWHAMNGSAAKEISRLKPLVGGGPGGAKLQIAPAARPRPAVFVASGAPTRTNGPDARPGEANVMLIYTRSE